MANKILIGFSGYRSADARERIGNLGLGLLRIGFGRNLKVTQVDSSEWVFNQKSYSKGAKIIAVSLFVLALPITGLSAGVGTLAVLDSKSYRRTFKAYTQSQHLLSHSQFSIEDQAAAKIQKMVRGYLVRKGHLPSSLYARYLAECKSVRGLKGHLLPQASGGKTSVYLPTEVPEVVLKDTGKKKAIIRFHQSQEVRALLRKQGSSHLVISRANLCCNFLVEERLSIDSDSFHNMAIYLANLEKFDSAVRELVRLFSKVYLGSLVSYQIDPLGNLENVGDYVRYDNLPLYLEKGVGKIGLIDLEHLENKPSPKALETLVRIFPYHLDVIKKEAFKRQMKIHSKTLDIASKRGKIYLQKGYVDHLNWIKQRGECLPYLLNEKRQEEITVLVEKELLQLNLGINKVFAWKNHLHAPQKNFLVGDCREKLAKEIVPLFLKNLKSKLRDSKKAELSDHELVRERSVKVKRPKLYQGIDLLIKECAKFEKRETPEEQEIASQLVDAMMKELVKGGEIFYFDPAYYTETHDFCWVRY